MSIVKTERQPVKKKLDFSLEQVWIPQWKINLYYFGVDILVELILVG